jgi:hypothetical protein
MKLFERENDDNSGLSRIFVVEHMIATSTHDVTLLTYLHPYVICGTKMSPKLDKVCLSTTSYNP